MTAIAETPDAAKKEATRLAIQQVAGVFVDNRRRVEIKMSDQKLSEIVEEKILSYTNAYVTKLEVLSTERQSEGYAIKAKVTVEIAPLLKTLQASNVPMVAFDADSAVGTAESLGDEKRNALAIYSDLLARADGLVKIGLGRGQVAPSIPSTADSAWVSIPITFFMTADGLQEWRKKFELISNKDKRARVMFGVTHSKALNRECALPELSSHDAYFGNSFLSQRPGSGQVGVEACFLIRSGPTSFIADCFGRAFVVPDPQRYCTRGSDCYSLKVSASSIRLTVEFLDKDEQVIFSNQFPFSNFPEINRRMVSHSAPVGKEAAFFNYCADEQDIFFGVSSNQPQIPFGDVIIFPPPGSRINGRLNVLLPNETFGRIASTRAFIKKGP